jgi:uncharacterized membrane protein YphA (DoxX/SURF4 family)
VSAVTESGPKTSGRKPAVLILGILGVLFLLLAIVYLAVPAKDLPGFIGYVKNGGSGKHDLRMAIAFVIAIACGAGAWFLSRSRKTASK